ncbi:LOW QUALITY PROTEIN: mucin-2 [Numenius arquata]|uniref:LOW QUALITY PROTEIN: mucin-2 n=1 Tax=Numenius arquata TaxID=31919 RepID=UPI003D30D23B
MGLRVASLFILWLALSNANEIRKGRTRNHGHYVCSTWGNNHFKTFDGDIYQFPGICEYNFASDCRESYKEFSIHIQRALNSNNHPEIQYILLTIKDFTVYLKPKLAVVDGRIVKTPYYSSGLLIEINDIYTKVYAKLGLILIWNQEDALMVELDSKFNNHTCGLCGDYNGVPIYNEFINGDASYNSITYGNLQKISKPNAKCEDPDETQALPSCNGHRDECERLLTSSAFADCRLRLNLETYIQACMQDKCACNGNEDSFCLCSTISEYSRQCSHAGGRPSEWRTQYFCPKTCPDTMIYKESSSPCMDTCSHLGISSLCEEHYMDGCFCPEGTVYDDITEKGCIPASQCHCKLHGKEYSPGENITNECEECTCDSGRWMCKDLPCPGTCSVEGGSHITTFDGKKYTFHGDCYYVLTKGPANDSHALLAELAPCGSSDRQTCLKSIVLLVDHKRNVVVFRSDGSVLLNDMTVNVPHVSASFSVFKPSSYYLVVQTSSGLQLQIQLFPVMQVFVTVDQSVQGKLQGLCGNFNGMEGDDFKTSSGLVEATGSAFANTWKAQSTCTDQVEKLEDPCSLSIESANYAEHWCSLLKNPEGPFARCHVIIDPSEYYKKCKYDTCLCEDNEECLCAALSSYSRACAFKGIILGGWRKSVCSNEVSACPGNQIFLYNLTMCQQTCRSLADGEKHCLQDFAPVDGCGCPYNTYLDNQGTCVPMSECPCYYKGSYLEPGEYVTRDGERCVCRNAKVQCTSVTIRTKIATECSSNKTYFDCNASPHWTSQTPVQLSCHTRATDHFQAECVSGCVCPEGLFDDGKGGCVEEKDCPCSHNNQQYSPGEKITVDCNTCTCQKGDWSCTKDLCYGTCMIYGSGHYITFDGKFYDFDGSCEYVATQDFCGDTNSSGSFSIITENVPCGTTGVTCSKAIKIFLGKTELKLENKDYKEIQRDIGDDVQYWNRTVGLYLVIEASNGVMLIWDKKTTVFIKLTPDYKGKVCGLCGNFDDKSNNDFTTRSGLQETNALKFGNSWKQSSMCPDVTEEIKPCDVKPHRKSWAEKECSIIQSEVFKICHSKVDPIPFYEACVHDACSCDSGGDCECFCSAVAAYAQECTKAQACVFWRTPDICPIFCDYYNPRNECDWHYEPCGSNVTTCRMINNISTNFSVPYLEGCYPRCPEDKPIYNEETKKCVRGDECGCYIDGIYVPPGTEIPTEENCKNCLCGPSGSIVCTPVPGCPCVINGTSYQVNDTVAQIKDGDICIIYICAENGSVVVGSIYPCPTSASPTIISTSFPTSTLTTTVTTTSPPVTTTPCFDLICNWTEWFDVSNPEEDGGDNETYEAIKEHGKKICETPEKIECRAKDNPHMSLEELGQKVECNVTFGLICKNEEQDATMWELCYNYEIRVNCCELHEVPCGTPSTPSLTPTATSTTTSTTVPTTTITRETTSITTMSIPTPTITRQPPSSVTSPETSTSPECPCEWTDWIDVSYPDASDRNGGDYETFENIIANNPSWVCNGVENISCRAEKFPDVPIEDLGQKVECNVSKGLICNNRDQTIGGPIPMPVCLNYQISVCCTPSPESCSPSTTTRATPTSTMSTVPTSTTTSTPTPSEGPPASVVVPQLVVSIPTASDLLCCCPPECPCEWTDWIDVSYPDASDRNGGDYETFENIIANNPSWVCNGVENISCRAEKFPDVPIEDLGQKVECNVSKGLICNNRDQTIGGPIPMPVCLNYQISVCCTPSPESCSPSTTTRVTPTSTMSTVPTSTTTSTPTPSESPSSSTTTTTMPPTITTSRSTTGTTTTLTGTPTPTPTTTTPSTPTPTYTPSTTTTTTTPIPPESTTPESETPTKTSTTVTPSPTPLPTTRTTETESAVSTVSTTIQQSTPSVPTSNVTVTTSGVTETRPSTEATTSGPTPSGSTPRSTTIKTTTPPHEPTSTGTGSPSTGSQTTTITSSRSTPGTTTTLTGTPTPTPTTTTPSTPTPTYTPSTTTTTTTTGESTTPESETPTKTSTTVTPSPTPLPTTRTTETESAVSTVSTTIQQSTPSVPTSNVTVTTSGVTETRPSTEATTSGPTPSGSTPRSTTIKTATPPHEPTSTGTGSPSTGSQTTTITSSRSTTGTTTTLTGTPTPTPTTTTPSTPTPTYTPSTTTTTTTPIPPESTTPESETPTKTSTTVTPSPTPLPTTRTTETESAVSTVSTTIQQSTPSVPTSNVTVTTSGVTETRPSTEATTSGPTPSGSTPRSTTIKTATPPHEPTSTGTGSPSTGSQTTTITSSRSTTGTTTTLTGTPTPTPTTTTPSTPTPTYTPSTTTTTTTPIPPECPCEWTDWIDVSYPDASDRNGGDYETFENIIANNPSWVCNGVENISCRAEKFPDVPIEDLGQKVECNVSKGLICNNRDQTIGGPIPMPVCLNYQISVCCTPSPESCSPSTTTRATPTSTMSTVPTSTTTSTPTTEATTSGPTPSGSTPRSTTIKTTTPPHEPTSTGTGSPSTGSQTTTITTSRSTPGTTTTLTGTPTPTPTTTSTSGLPGVSTKTPLPLTTQALVGTTPESETPTKTSTTVTPSPTPLPTTRTTETESAVSNVSTTIQQSTPSVPTSNVTVTTSGVTETRPSTEATTSGPTPSGSTPRSTTIKTTTPPHEPTSTGTGSPSTGSQTTTITSSRSTTGTTTTLTGTPTPTPTTTTPSTPTPTYTPSTTTTTTTTTGESTTPESETPTKTSTTVTPSPTPLPTTRTTETESAVSTVSTTIQQSTPSVPTSNVTVTTSGVTETRPSTEATTSGPTPSGSTPRSTTIKTTTPPHEPTSTGTGSPSTGSQTTTITSSRSTTGTTTTLTGTPTPTPTTTTPSTPTPTYTPSTTTTTTTTTGESTTPESETPTKTSTTVTPSPTPLPTTRTTETESAVSTVSTTIQQSTPSVPTSNVTVTTSGVTETRPSTEATTSGPTPSGSTPRSTTIKTTTPPHEPTSTGTGSPSTGSQTTTITTTTSGPSSTVSTSSTTVTLPSTSTSPMSVTTSGTTPTQSFTTTSGTTARNFTTVTATTSTTSKIVSTGSTSTSGPSATSSAITVSGGSTYSTVTPLSPSSSTTSPPPSTSGKNCSISPNESYAPGQSWWLCNCTNAICIEDNIIQVVPMICNPPPKPTCANGLSPVQVIDKDGCCWHWECDCYCTGWGDPHYMTFDGLYYSYQGNCTYVLVEEIHEKVDNFGVYIDNYHCDSRDVVSCPRTLIVRHETQEVRIATVKPNTFQVEVTVNKQPVALPYKKFGLSIYESGINHVVEIPELKMNVTYNGLSFSIRMPYSLFGNNTHGQCGTCNNNTADDCMLPNGNIAENCETMADHWQVHDPSKPQCSPGLNPTKAPSTTPVQPCKESSICELLLGSVFEPCHSFVRPEKYYLACVFDSCVLPSLDLECSSLQIYAATCADQSVCIDWRNHTNGVCCSYKCPSDKEYRACGPIKETTCKSSPQNETSTKYVEGCFCPDGTMLYDPAVDVCVKTCGCVGVDKIPREFGEKFTVDCQDCICLEGGNGIVCEPHVCAKQNKTSCDGEGFYEVNEVNSEDSCCPIVTCKCNTSLCTANAPKCALGFEVHSHIPSGQCCPVYQCVPKRVCVHQNAEFLPNSSVFVDKCQNCFCTNEVNVSTQLNIISCEHIPCNTYCKPGYELQPVKGECCGRCVQTKCVIHTTDNSDVILSPGEFKNDPNDNCTIYSCSNIHNQLISSTSEITCPAFNEETCKPGTITFLPNGCCKTCAPLDNPTPCSVRQRQDFIVYKGCRSVDRVLLTECEGTCGTFSLYSAEANSMEHSCSCCRESKTIVKNAELKCPNGDSISHKYIFVQSCSCQDTECSSSQSSESQSTEENDKASTLNRMKRAISLTTK